MKICLYQGSAMSPEAQTVPSPRKHFDVGCRSWIQIDEMLIDVYRPLVEYVASVCPGSGVATVVSSISSPFTSAAAGTAMAPSKLVTIAEARDFLTVILLIL